MINRRGLLLGILSSGISPGIIHNPMKLWIPRQEIHRLIPSDSPIFLTKYSELEAELERFLYRGITRRHVERSISIPSMEK